jgi:hypothetical protein
MLDYQQLWNTWKTYLEDKIAAERAKAKEARLHQDTLTARIHGERQAVLEDVRATMQAKERLSQEVPENSPKGTQKTSQLFNYPEDYDKFE